MSAFNRKLPLWQQLNVLSHRFGYDSPEANAAAEAALALREQAPANEPTFTLAVRLSVVVDGWANDANPLTRETIAELVARRLESDIESAIDGVDIIEIRDAKERPVVAANALGEWHDATPPRSR